MVPGEVSLSRPRLGEDCRERAEVKGEAKTGWLRDGPKVEKAWLKERGKEARREREKERERMCVCMNE